MESNRTRRLIGTLLIILTTTSVSKGFQHQQRNTTFFNRLRRAVETPGVGSLLPQPDICREFVESKVVLKGSKATSPADIFNDLPIGKDFATAGRKYAKDYIFQSPDYPHNYPNSMQCIKLIVAPSDEHRIYLQILHPFALEPDSLCAMDFLEVRDGAYGFSPLIGRFCSRFPPPEKKEISSSGQFLWLRFRSDSTIPHGGFRAIYHFEKLNDGTQDNQDYQPKILRKQSLFELKEDEQWTLRHEFLIKQLETITPEEHQLPLEAVFDIRSPSQTHILMHVHHFQVPQVAAWSCNPDYLAHQKAIKYCDYHSGSPAVYSDTFTEKPPNLLQVKSYTPSVPDPSSHIDGKHTFIEIYADGNTVTDSSPPCPCVERFCIASAATDLIDSSTSASSSNKGTEDGHQQRQFLVLAPRLVVRLVVAKPSKMEASQPETSSNEQFTLTDVENTDGLDENEESLNIFSMLPNFTITVTALSPRINGACAPSQRSCDENYCIQNAHWCDGIINCPLGQDEGEAACNPEKAGAIENPEETGTTSMSEKDKAALEKAMEERADLEKHASIIGCISLIMLIFTAICM
uniref:CUB domain-containing protein n=2 Tax=Mesocestoides corti TaxID=53468 RepID=A0A5K3EWN1_MESCO